jgi:hypothetical protein
MSSSVVLFPVGAVVGGRGGRREASRRLALLACVVGVALVSGCADALLAGAGHWGGDDGSAGAVVATPGCDPGAIVDDGDVRCASCAFGSVEDGAGTGICGRPVEALCETRQNSSGAACQLCVTAAGEMLYDDCFTAGESSAVASNCEVTVDATTNERCSTCFDADGSVVSVTCGPQAETCAEQIVDGRRCEVCTADGVTVSSTCAAAEFDPRRCVGYGNEAGACVDCFDDTGALLSHQCTNAGGDAASCAQTVQPEGLVCTVCSDAQGTVVTRSCESALPQPARCADLAFSEQSCVVCVDVNDVVVRADCRRNDCEAVAAACRVDADCPADFACFDGSCVAAQGTAGNDGPETSSECAPPPACTNDVNDSGDVCRSCPRADGVVETRCMPSSRLACETLPEDQLPQDSDRLDDAEAPPPQTPSQGRTCTICRDAPSGIEVFRDCEGNGAVPPPVCIDGVDVGDQSCTVCYDAVTRAPVYRSCPIDTCAAMTSAPLVDGTGASFVFEGPIARIETATCEQCRQGDALVTGEQVGAFQPRCIVDSPCTNGNGGDATTACPITTRLLLAPLSCAQPWDAFDTDATTGADPTVQGELRSVLEFLLAGGVFAISAEQVQASAGGCDACTCERGDRIAVDVWSFDEQRARGLLGDVVVVP